MAAAISQPNFPGNCFPAMTWEKVLTPTATRDVDLQHFRQANHIPLKPTLNPKRLTKDSLLWFHENRVVFVAGEYAFFGGEPSTEAPTVKVCILFHVSSI